MIAQARTRLRGPVLTVLGVIFVVVLVLGVGRLVPQEPADLARAPNPHPAQKQQPAHDEAVREICREDRVVHALARGAHEDRVSLEEVAVRQKPVHDQ